MVRYALAAFLVLAAPAHAQCPVAPEASKLPSAAQLRKLNSIIAHGARPTGSGAQARYVKWIRDRLNNMPGVKLSGLDYTISRFTPSSTIVQLRIGKRVRRLGVAGP